MKDSLQRQRFEYKYHVTESQALAIRDFVSGYLSPDSYGATQPNLSYPVHSIYFDSPGFKTYQDTINGEKNRYKLRLRYYESGEDSPVYLEMKRRMNHIIIKSRASIKRETADHIARGFSGGYDDLVNPDDESFYNLKHISERINILRAQPRVHVSYLREAWMADGTNKIRVTFDRSVKTEPVKEIVFKNEMTNPTDVFGSNVILELKFTDRFPEWFKSLVQVFGLRQASAAKYVDGLINLERKHLIRL